MKGIPLIVRIAGLAGFKRDPAATDDEAWNAQCDLVMSLAAPPDASIKAADLVVAQEAAAALRRRIQQA